MTTNHKFLLSFEDVPFVGDESREFQCVDNDPRPRESLYQYVNRVIPFRWLKEVYESSLYPGRNTGHLARVLFTEPGDAPRVQVGEWHYPTGASRFSIFRGLATSSQAKLMLERGARGGEFVMKCEPDSPHKNRLGYEIRTEMFLLPPRPLAEHGAGLDGLYLITLVDERQSWRAPYSTKTTTALTWPALLQGISEALGVELTMSDIEAVYGLPDPDSQIWCNAEDAALLLDCVAYNVGRTVVRKFDGSYELYTPQESRTIAEANRGSPVTRIAGGDLFSSGKGLKAGNLQPSKELICPEEIVVTFPKYVFGDDPVPHYFSKRTSTLWYQDSYGEVFEFPVPINSGGQWVSGMSGRGSITLHETYKAGYLGESGAKAVGGFPDNFSGNVRELGLKVAQDFYAHQALASYDEVYPGTVKWTPEGLHDVLWTYSERAMLASCRVMRAEWTAAVRELQHGESNYLTAPGGPLIALTVKDEGTKVHHVNLITTIAPLSVQQGVRTEGGVIEAQLRLGVKSGGARSGIGGWDGEVFFEGTSFYFYGEEMGLSLIGNSFYFLGQSTFNFYGGGSIAINVFEEGDSITIVGGNPTFNYYGVTINYFQVDQFETTIVFNNFINNYGGTVYNFFSGSIVIIDGDASLIVLNQGGGGELGCPRFFTFYQHTSEPLPNVGDQVAPGAQLSTLVAVDTGSHLHFALGDAYTPFGQAGGTGSMVGNTVDLNAGERWFPMVGQRAQGGAGPTPSNFNATQLAWILSRLRKPVDGSLLWVQQLGSPFHVGPDYYAIDVHTQPTTPDWQQDVGRTVYNLANSNDITTRVVFKGEFANGWALVLQHDKNTDGCNPGALATGIPTGEPPCLLDLAGGGLLIFVVNYFYYSPTFITLTFSNINVYFDELTIVTFAGGVKFHGGWWLHYRDVDVEGVVTLLAGERVVVRVNTTGGSIAGIIPIPDGGAGQVLWIINYGSGDLTIINSSGATDPAYRILCPDGDDLVLSPQSGCILWYDPENQFWDVVGFCCGGAATDQLVKVSSNDTTANFLLSKLVAGTNITLTENNDGGNETITIATTGATLDSGRVDGSSYNVTASYATVTNAEVTIDSGNYFITATFEATMSAYSQGDTIQVKLYDVTNAIEVGHAVTAVYLQIIPPALATGTVNGGGSITFRYPVLADNTNIELQAKYNALGTAPAAATISASTVSYVKIS